MVKQKNKKKLQIEFCCHYFIDILIIKLFFLQNYRAKYSRTQYGNGGHRGGRGGYRGGYRGGWR